MKFSERLKYLRKESDFSQRDISEILGISVSAYQYYEQGKTEPRLDNLVKLADLFHVSMDFLIGRMEE